MIHDFQANENSEELTLHVTHMYIWSLTPAWAKYFCWNTLAGHEEVLDWINSLDSDQDQYLDPLCACLVVFSVTDGQIIPRQFQLLAGLAALWGKNSIVNAGTGSGKLSQWLAPAGESEGCCNQYLSTETVMHLTFFTFPFPFLSSFLHSKTI